MSVRKRTWTTSNGDEREAWIVDYVDQAGERRLKTFATKKAADAWSVNARHEVQQGVHIPESKSITVAEAAEAWITYITQEERERSTIEHYRNHVDNHINTRIGREKLAKLTSPRIQAFRDDLLANLSRASAKKVLTSLKMMLSDAQRRGNVAQNVALPVKITKDKRAKRKLAVGVDIPSPAEIKDIIHTATGRARPFLITAIFTGLRSSELRGLRWDDLDLGRGELSVRQRADRFNKIGAPKSESGNRTIPLGPFIVNTLKEWQLACPKGELGLVFPNNKGKPCDHSDIVVHHMGRVMVRAGVVDANGEPKYTGLHALRHFYALWCINSKKDGGLELPIKTVQQRLGSIVMTGDVYGHLFPSTDDGKELADAEKALLSVR